MSDASLTKISVFQVAGAYNLRSSSRTSKVFTVFTHLHLDKQDTKDSK